MRDAAGELRDAADALREAGISPVALQEKEGLALINGTDGMLGMLVLAIADLRMLLATADITAAMSVEGLLGTDAAFDDDLQRLRPQAGQAAAAANMRAVLADSAIVASHRGPEDTTVQDAYSLRCAPAVAGAARDTVEHAALVASRELASAIDNPVITLDGRVRSNGNFHGAPVGLRPGFPRHRRCRCREHVRTPDRPLSRHRPQPRAERLPRRRSGGGFRAHDRPVHPGGDRLGAEAARGPGERRLDPEFGDARGPRVDGLVGGAEAADGRRRAHPRTGDRAADRGPRHRAAHAAQLRLPLRPRSSQRCARARRGRARTGSWRRRSRPRCSSSPAAALGRPRNR